MTHGISVLKDVGMGLIDGRGKIADSSSWYYTCHVTDAAADLVAVHLWP